VGLARGFFKSRRIPDVKFASGGSKKHFAEYANISPILASVISSKLATLYELQTVYGLEDCYNLLEIVIVDNYNNRQEK